MTAPVNPEGQTARATHVCTVCGGLFRLVVDNPLLDALQALDATARDCEHGDAVEPIGGEA